jgi:hypothetical protein
MTQGSDDEVLDGTLPNHLEIDEFWMKFGHEIVSKQLEGLDERAKFMITTCAGLIVIDFGLLFAFSTPSLSLRVVPQFFFAISALFFSFSYFPRGQEIQFEAPDEIKNAYTTLTNAKIQWHRYGFTLFFIGLLAMAITSLIGS